METWHGCSIRCQQHNRRGVVHPKSVMALSCSCLIQNLAVCLYCSGKTHTMMGTPSDAGVVPRAIRALFERIDSSEDW